MTKKLLLGVAAWAALAGGAMPSAAAAASAITADSLPAASAVSRFYEARQQPLWLRSPDAVRTLLDTLRSAPVDGLEQGPDLAAAIERALRATEAGIPGADREAERLMSNAFVLHAQALKWPGRAGMIFADPALAPIDPRPSKIRCAGSPATGEKRHDSAVAL